MTDIYWYACRSMLRVLCAIGLDCLSWLRWDAGFLGLGHTGQAQHKGLLGVAMYWRCVNQLTVLGPGYLPKWAQQAWICMSEA